MNSKKAQSEIITTVLIILLVLAAIIIVWQVVSSTIGKANTGINDNNLCIGTQLTIVKAISNGTTSQGNVTVQREAATGNSANVTVRVFINGIQQGVSMGPMDIYTKNTTNYNIPAGAEVKVAALLSQDNFLCPATQTVTAVAP